MVGRRGWLRIVEASIAIMIIFGVLLAVNARQNFGDQQDLTRISVPILEEIARNITLRDHIVTLGRQSEPELKVFVDDRIKQSTINIEVRVCESNEICSLPVYPADATELYATERVISSTLQNFAPKKVKIFLWQGQA